MKWIGQHIWDFISRFRSDVYLEGTETGTIASGGNLGLDSNNKIVKADTESGELSFTGSTANGVLTYLDADSIQVEPNWYYDGSTDIATFKSSDSTKPIFSVVNQHSGNAGGQLRFQRTTAGSDNDALGYILFHGSNAASELTSFANITGGIETAADTDEAGKLSLEVATSNDSTSALQQALTATGHGTNNTVDVGLGYGAASTTTVEGNLIVKGATTIKVFAHEFRANNDGGAAVIYDDASGYTSMAVTDAANDLSAVVRIPEGFSVTHVHVYASVTATSCTAKSINYTNGAVGTTTSGATPDAWIFDTNSNYQLVRATDGAAYPLASGSTQDLIISYTPGATNYYLYGAKVTIAVT